MSSLIPNGCAALGALSWCLGAFLFVRARRDYRGPAGRALWSNPFALWEPTNYTGAGELRIRRSFLCLMAFFACVALGFVVVQLMAIGKF